MWTYFYNFNRHRKNFANTYIPWYCRFHVTDNWDWSCPQKLRQTPTFLGTVDFMWLTTGTGHVPKNFANTYIPRYCRFHVTDNWDWSCPQKLRQTPTFLGTRFHVTDNWDLSCPQKLRQHLHSLGL